MSKLKHLLISLIGTGIGVFLIGLYFSMIGAGLPYQDPTEEMTIRWLANDLAGSLCMKVGGIVFSPGISILIIESILKRRNKAKKLS